VNSGFLDRTTLGGARPYQLYVPRQYTPDRRWPVVLFLHGAGEGGEDGLLQTEFQLGSAIRRHSALFECLAVFPQQSPSRYWRADDLSMAMDCLELTCNEYPVDPDRVTLCGVSSGAIGAWALAARFPRRFSRLLIVSGLVGPTAFVPADGAVAPATERDPHLWLSTRLRSLPIWIHHGDADPLYPVEDARRTVGCLRDLQSPVRYSELPGFGHNVWDTAFYSESVIRWLLGAPPTPKP
jgi:predicted peptidase